MTRHLAILVQLPALHAAVADKRAKNRPEAVIDALIEGRSVAEMRGGG